MVLTVDERDCGSAEPAVDAARWAVLAAAVLRDENILSGELGLSFVDPGRMAGLNREHMGANGPTDVLAFQIDGADPAPPNPDASALIGDVVVCPARAAAQATEHAGPHHDGSVEDELALLVVHGVLHVLGYDHVNDAAATVMQARERQLLAEHHRLP